MRRRTAPYPTSNGGDLIPRRLLERQPGMTPEDVLAQSREKGAWLRAHGVDPGDWSQVHPLLNASKRHHGIPTALDRARDRHTTGGRA